MSRNSILGLYEPEKLNFLIFLYLRALKISFSAELSMKIFYNLGTWSAPFAKIYMSQYLVFLQLLAF